MAALEKTKEEAVQAVSYFFVTSYDDLAKAIITPIVASYEEDIEDHPAFDVISDELMKRGTLSHGSINWGLVENSALEMLKGVQKSIAVVEALFLARMTRKTRGALACCIRGYDSYLSMPEELFYPKEDRRFELIIRRTCKLFDLDSLPGNPGSEAEGLEQSLIRLSKNELLVGLGLTKGFRVLLERLELEKKQVELAQEQKVETASGSPSSSATAAASNAKLMDPRTFKRTTAEICTVIFHQDPSLPYIYQLRRHACWQDITAAPQINSGDKTIIPVVSIDTCDKYRQASEQNKADTHIIYQLETTLYSMPFWLEGQYLAAQLALKADHIQVANAILESTQQFVRRIPELRNLCFEDGTPFIEGNTIDWLNTKPRDADAPPQLDEQQDSKTLSNSVSDPRFASKWNREYKSYKSPRQKALWN